MFFEFVNRNWIELSVLHYLQNDKELLVLFGLMESDPTLPAKANIFASRNEAKISEKATQFPQQKPS